MPEGLEGLRIYQLAEELADAVWDEVLGWSVFPRDTLGRQLVDAADSVEGNIAEGYGRYHYRDNRQFQYYARGSMFETRYWLRRAHRRDLLSDERFNELSARVEALAPQLNAYIRTLGRKSTSSSTKKHVPDESQGSHRIAQLPSCQIAQSSSCPIA